MLGSPSFCLKRFWTVFVRTVVLVMSTPSMDLILRTIGILFCTTVKSSQAVSYYCSLRHPISALILASSESLSESPLTVWVLTLIRGVTAPVRTFFFSFITTSLRTSASRVLERLSFAPHLTHFWIAWREDALSVK